MSRKHECPNRFYAEGANGGCFFDVAKVKEGVAILDVGWSCVIVHNRREIPVTWLAEIIAVATAHKKGIAGFLADAAEAGGYESYALMCDPVEEPQA